MPKGQRDRVLQREDRDVKREDTRPDRIPVSGNRDILTVHNKEKGFVYRWVLDVGNRIPKFQQGGYEVAPDNGILVGDARTGVPTQYGSAVVATSKDGQKLVLMRIKEEWFNEDQNAKEDSLRATEDSMSELGEGQYGSTGIINQARR
jgi:hypothetical protein